MLSPPPLQDKTWLSPRWHKWISDLFAALGVAVKLPNHTVSTLPDAAKNTYGLVIVTDEAGGCVPAFSDGTNWRRVTDRNIVS